MSAVASVRHCVLGAFTDEATAEQKEAMFAALRALPAKVPGICSLVCGPDLGLADGNHGFAINVEFATEEDYKVYATHPEHVAVITKRIKPILKPGSRTAVQFLPEIQAASRKRSAEQMSEGSDEVPCKLGRLLFFLSLSVDCSANFSQIFKRVFGQLCKIH